MTERYRLDLFDHQVHVYPALVVSDSLWFELVDVVGVFGDLLLELVNGAGLLDGLGFEGLDLGLEYGFLFVSQL